MRWRTPLGEFTYCVPQITYSWILGMGEEGKEGEREAGEKEGNGEDRREGVKEWDPRKYGEIDTYLHTLKLNLIFHCYIWHAASLEPI